MPQESFNQRISSLKEQLEGSVAENLAAALTCCDALEQCAYEVDSNELRAYCRFYRGLAYYIHSELTIGYDLLSRSVEALCQTGQWALVGRAYNALGNIAYFQGEFFLAVDYFFTGIRFCREHLLPNLVYRITNNIADIYMALGEYRLAVEKLLFCADGLENSPDFEGSYAIVYSNLAYCYIHLGELSKAEHYMEKATALSSDSVFDRCSLLFLQIKFYHSMGDHKKRDEVIEILRDTDISSVAYDFMNEIESHARLLIEIERYDVLDELLGFMDRAAPSLSAKETLCKIKLEYFEKLGAEDAYLQQAAQFYEISRQLEWQSRKISVHSILNRSSLEKEMAIRTKTEQDNCLLRERSETDALTGIKNRLKLNEVAEDAFQRAYINGTALGVELLDIDFYKEYNDNYGHQAGDECLIAIARVLRRLEEHEGIHVGRYGGDEFMILYENYSREEILTFAEQIRESVTALQVEHQYSRVAPCVTVSQGIFHKIPVGTNRLWDLTYCADIALYTVKDKGRNNYFLATSVQEIKDFAGDDSRFAR